MIVFVATDYLRAKLIFELVQEYYILFLSIIIVGIPNTSAWIHVAGLDAYR